jgi:hypothetical protein
MNSTVQFMLAVKWILVFKLPYSKTIWELYVEKLTAKLRNEALHCS